MLRRMLFGRVVVALLIGCLVSGFCFLNEGKFEHMQSSDSYIVTTLVGAEGTGKPRDGKKEEASFTNHIVSLAVDASGNVFVNDNRSLRKIAPDGSVVTLFGQNVYDNKGEIKKVPPMISAVNGGSIIEILDVMVGASNTLYLSSEERAIYRLSRLKDLTLYAGRMPEAEYNESPNGDGDLNSVVFRLPQDMHMDKVGNIYLIDKFRMVRKISPSGKVTTIVGNAADTRGQRAEEPILKTGPASVASLANAGGIAVDSKGNIFVSQPEIHCIVKITPTGAVSTFAGSSTSTEGETRDGIGTNARFFTPGALTIDQADNIYVADKRKVRRITPKGVVETIAGGAAADERWWEPGYKDGNGADALFTLITAIDCDSDGNVYVADAARVRKIIRK